MEELLKINEEYLAKLKYDLSSKYYGWSMALILNDLFIGHSLIFRELYERCRFLSSRIIDDRYLEIRLPDYSIIVFGFRGEDFESRIFSFDARFLDRFCFNSSIGSKENS